MTEDDSGCFFLFCASEDADLGVWPCVLGCRGTCLKADASENPLMRTSSIAVSLTAQSQEAQFPRRRFDSPNNNFHISVETLGVHDPPPVVVPGSRRQSVKDWATGCLDLHYPPDVREHLVLVSETFEVDGKIAEELARGANSGAVEERGDVLTTSFWVTAQVLDFGLERDDLRGRFCVQHTVPVTINSRIRRRTAREVRSTSMEALDEISPGTKGPVEGSGSASSCLLC